MPGVRSRHGAIAIPPSERRLLFRLQAEHALYPARSQSPPAPAHNPLSLPVSLPHPRLAPSADTLVMVVCLLPGGTQVCPSGRSQPPDSGSSPGGNRPLRLRHHHNQAATQRRHRLRRRRQRNQQRAGDVSGTPKRTISTPTRSTGSPALTVARVKPHCKFSHPPTQLSVVTRGAPRVYTLQAAGGVGSS